MFLRVKTHSANCLMATMILYNSGVHIFFLIIIKILKWEKKNLIYKSEKFLRQTHIVEDLKETDH